MVRLQECTPSSMSLEAALTFDRLSLVPVASGKEVRANENDLKLR
jgi:hypothetical protein